MIKRRKLRVMLSIVLSLLMLVDYTVFMPSPVHALDKKSALIGGAIGAVGGAGIVLAAPAIAGAVGAAGAGLAGVGTAICGGLAAVGGAITGAVAAVGGAIGAAFGAIGGFFAGIFASPLFIPALLIIGAAVVGYVLYKKYKKKKAAEGGSSDEVLPINDEIYVSPGDYDMAEVFPEADEAPPVDIGDDDVLVIDGAQVATIGDEPPASISVVEENNDGAAQAPSEEPASVSNSQSLKEAHDRYIAAYQKYTTLVTNSGGARPSDVKKALEDYRAAYQEYQNLKMTSGRK